MQVQFKQIVGRGTRLFDGKDYFTVFDFVNAHEHFQDPEWDGEPLEPVEPTPRGPGRPCATCGAQPCECEREPNPICEVCENDPCVCEEAPRAMIKIKLSANKVLEIDSMIRTSFWSPDGKPISSTEFIKALFGDIPSLFKDEAELRRIWSLPDTRKKLLEALSEKGYTHNQIEDLKKLIHAEDSDLYDVLSHIAYEKELVPRMARAERARVHFNSYNPAQQEFLNFVLDQYVKSGVAELDDEKLGDLLILKYEALADAKQQLGDIPSIRNTFIGFQEYLYTRDAV